MRDAAVIEAINAALQESARWGFWKCYDQIRNLGYRFNHKRVHRSLLSDELNLPRRAKRRLPNRGALGIDIAASIPAVRVIAFVEQLIDLHGPPRALRCDNGPELISDAFSA